MPLLAIKARIWLKAVGSAESLVVLEPESEPGVGVVVYKIQSGNHSPVETPVHAHRRSHRGIPSLHRVTLSLTSAAYAMAANKRSEKSSVRSLESETHWRREQRARRKGQSMRWSASSSCERFMCEGSRVGRTVLKYLFNTNWPDYTSNRHRVLIYLASQSHNQRIRTLLVATRKDLITNITSLSLDLAKLREKGN